MTAVPAEGKCSHCGAPLPSAGWEGLCPKCLVRCSLESSETEDQSKSQNLTPFLSSTLEVGKSEIGGLRRFGDYELIEEIARGGMGVVYKARQIKLNRTVAVKMILAGQLASPADVQRFRAEAEAAAHLNHRNIVAIHETGQFDGQDFFSMDYVQGQNLAQFVGQKPLPPKQAANYLKTIAEAIQYAHEHGILHRDLKPSNILIDDAGQPRITDFGLAKRLGLGSELLTIDPQLTLSGQVLGSPNFMPPEQAAGKRGQVGPPADVYALGAILYFMLTARPPFAAESLSETLRQVMNIDPPPPRLINPTVPRDLETICLKCLEKETPRRYETARQLAEELGRFLRGEPIFARPANRLEKSWRWCGRNPAVATFAGATLLLLLALATGSPIAVFRISREKKQATEKLWQSYRDQARANRWSGRVGRRFDSLEVLKRAAEIRPSLELRNEAIACLTLPDLRISKQWETSPGNQIWWAFDSHAQRYAKMDVSQHLISVHRVTDNLELMRASGVEPPCLASPRFSPNGQYLAVACGNQPPELRVWDLNQKKIVLQPTDSHFRCLDFSADSRLLAVSFREVGPIVIYDLASGKALRTLVQGPLPWTIAFDPSGQKLAVSSHRSEDVVIRNVETGAIIRTFSHPDTVKLVSWHPNGNFLAAACTDHNVYIWDTDSGKIRSTLQGHEAPVTNVHFDSTGDLLSSDGYDAIARVWDFRTGRQILSLAAVIIEFSSDEQWVHGGNDGTPTLWQFARGRECWTFHSERELGSGPVNLDFSPDHRLLASAHGDGVRLWDLEHYREIAQLGTGVYTGVAFHPNGQTLLAAGRHGLTEWPLDSHPVGQSNTVLLGHPLAFGSLTNAGSLALSRDGQSVATIMQENLCIFNRQTGRELHRFVAPRRCWSLGFSPDNKWIAAGPFGQDDVTVWNLATSRLERKLPSNDSAQVGFSPDNKWLVTASSTEYRFWKVGSWEQAHFIARRGAQDHAGCFAFTADGKMLAIAEGRSLVRLLDPGTCHEWATLEGPFPSEIARLRFNSDGSLLAAICAGHIIQLWDLRSIRQQLAAIKLDWDAPPLPPLTNQVRDQIKVTVPEAEAPNNLLEPVSH